MSLKASIQVYLRKSGMSWIAGILHRAYAGIVSVFKGFGLFLRKCREEFFKPLPFYIYNDWLTNFPSNRIRIFYLRKMLGVKIGVSSFVHMGCRFEGTIKVGRHSVLGRNCIFKGEITIGDNVSITAETYIFTSSHYVNASDFSCFYRPVIINNYAWIGARAMIMPGVSIGEGAVLAAGGIATKDIPDYEIFAGVPAKKIGDRSRDLRYELNYFPFFQ